MSNTSVAQVLSFLQPLKVEDCCILSITILVFYDHLLTFGQEVRYVWKSKLSSATIIFYLNRYLILAIALVDLIGFYPYNNVVSCEVVEYLYTILEVLWYAVWASFSAVRVFAISGRSWPLALLALAPGLVPCGTYIYSAVKTIYKPTHGMFEDSGCMAISTMSDSINDKLVIITRVCLIASDTIVIFSTWYFTWKVHRTTTQLHTTRSVVTLLLRDGTLYFLLLLSMNVLQITFFLTQLFDCTSEYIIRITALLVSRYILNLRHVHSRHGGTPSRTASGEGTGYESAIVSMPSSAPGHASILYGRQRSVYSKHHSYRGDTALRDMKWRHMHSTQSRTSGYTYTPGGWNDVPKAPWKYDEIDWELDGDYDEWWSELSGNEAATAVEMDTMRAPYRPAVGLQVAVEIEVQRDVDSIVEERPHGLEEVKLSRTVDVGYGEP